MKVLLLGNYDDTQKSMQRFSQLMKSSLTEQGMDVRLVRPPHILGKLPFHQAAVRKWIGYIDTFILYPLILRHQVRRADIVHVNDHCNAVYIGVIGKKPAIITCHDLVAVKKALGEFEGQRISFTGRILQNWILRSLKKFRCICCVSDHTRQDVLRLAGLNGAQVPVVENAINYPYSPMPAEECRARLRAMGLTPEQPFILHVGGNAWYKNRCGAVRIFAALRKRPEHAALKLVLAGEPWDEELRQTIAAELPEGAVIAQENVPNEDLRALYTAAAALLFPSLYEGFGWPVIEAQSCGCPVASSERSSLPEVGGAAATYFPPEDVAAAVQALETLLTEPEHYRRAGLENAARFTPERMAQGYIAAYRRELAAAEGAQNL